MKSSDRVGVEGAKPFDQALHLPPHASGPTAGYLWGCASGVWGFERGVRPKGVGEGFGPLWSRAWAWVTLWGVGVCE